MSVRSMTGYGRGAATRNGIHAEVELSSVNRKQLDIVLSIPKTLSSLEARIHEEIAAVLVRGRISVDVTIRSVGAASRQRVHFDKALAAAYRDVLREAASTLGVRDDIGIRMLTDLPGVLTLESPEEDPERVWPSLQQALRTALGALDRMRLREGRALAADLKKRIAFLQRISREIARLAPSAVERYRKTLVQRLEKLQLEGGMDESRLEREVVLFAERSDITEECTRIASHLRQAGELIRGNEPAGKALDFLAQELNREINTIASKSSDAEISQRVVLFRAELERIREQAQNIQ